MDSYKGSSTKSLRYLFLSVLRRLDQNYLLVLLGSGFTVGVICKVELISISLKTLSAFPVGTRSLVLGPFVNLSVQIQLL